MVEEYPGASLSKIKEMQAVACTFSEAPRAESGGGIYDIRQWF